MSQTGIIISREFNERVRKKSFIISTILMPLFVIAMMIVPSLIMYYATGDTRTVVVVDESGLIAQHLESNDDLVFVTLDAPLDEARKAETDRFGILHIGENIMENPNDVRLYANEASSMMVEESIASQIEDIIERRKLEEYDIRDLKTILDAVHTSVSLTVYRNDALSGEDELSSSSTAVSAIAGLVLGMILYMFLIIYGALVMQSVIEEKSSRVLEVMVSSVSPFRLMLGKILGVAAVAAVQIIIWGVLICGTCAVVLPMVIPADVAENVAALQAGTLDTMSTDVDVDVLNIVGTISDTGYMASIFVWLLLFMVGGYLLYSAMFAAIGSSVDSIQDASQFQMIVQMPIIISIFVMMTIMNNPSSAVAVWCSFIPFTSPVVMMARIPSGVPVWEIVTSLVILYITFAAMVWLAAKIYRVGIFMYGKKPTFKELWKWMTYKY